MNVSCKKLRFCDLGAMKSRPGRLSAVMAEVGYLRSFSSDR